MLVSDPPACFGTFSFFRDSPRIQARLFVVARYAYHTGHHHIRRRNLRSHGVLEGRPACRRSVSHTRITFRPERGSDIQLSKTMGRRPSWRSLGADPKRTARL